MVIFATERQVINGFYCYFLDFSGGTSGGILRCLFFYAFGKH